LKQEKSSQRKVGCVQPKGCSVWSTGLSGGAPDSVQCARLPRAKWSLSGIRRRRTAKIHRTVRCAPDCPVSQRSAGPTVGRGIRARHVAEPTIGRGHRTVRCAPDCPVSQRSAGPTVGRGIRARHVAEPTVGRVHRTVRCANSYNIRNGRLRRLRKEIGHRTVSGAPEDRRQDQPSRIALNGS
jgi:hypothetical protein